MPKRKKVSWKPVKLAEVTDVIAESWWEYWENGRKVQSRIAIGQPHPDPSGQDWYCPVLVQGRTNQWFPAYGVGAVDSLMNATRYASAFFHEKHITDLMDAPKKRRRNRIAKRRRRG